MVLGGGNRLREGGELSEATLKQAVSTPVLSCP